LAGSFLGPVFIGPHLRDLNLFPLSGDRPKTVKFRGCKVYSDLAAFHLTPATGSSFIGQKALVFELFTE
jgi:hypothetical protein